MTNFHVGQMVVCVKDAGHNYPDIRAKWGHILDKMTPAEIGRIYTVRDVETRTHILTLRLEEILGPVVDTHVGPFEIPYASTSFRPVKETSIQIFRDLVAPIKDKVRA